MKIKEFQHKPVQPDTYEASMALNQLMRIAKCGMKLHNMIDNDAEMESWVAKKIDLAGDYVKKVYNYTEADKAGLYDDSGMTEDAGEKIANMAQNMTKDEFMSIGSTSRYSVMMSRNSFFMRTFSNRKYLGLQRSIKSTNSKNSLLRGSSNASPFPAKENP